MAPTSTTSVTDWGTILSIFLSLVVVLALIFALAYIMRRFTVTSGGTEQLKVVASMMTGAKERIMVLQVGDEQHLIGVTSHQITHLHTLPEPIASKQQTKSKASPGGFQAKLVEAMAQHINPALKKSGTPNTSDDLSPPANDAGSKP